MRGLVSTGIQILDRRLGGGIPQGGTVLFTAPPASQSELVLARLAKANTTLYLTTGRPEASVRATVEQGRATGSGVSVAEVREEPLETASAILRSDDLPELVIVDRVGDLEDCDEERFQDLLWMLAGQEETAVVFYGLSGAGATSQRDRTAYVADMVLNLELASEDEEVENRLYVPKFRGGSALDEPVKLELTGRVFVDTSREIA
jgi:KaiC/GvpD/RAD55 family RecA-like ATPase